MDTLILESESLRLAFDRRTGALVGLTSLLTGWKILDRPHLGLSFLLLVPYPAEDPVDVAFAARMGRPRAQRRNNTVHGEKQTLAALETGADGRSATFTWRGLDTERAGRLDIEVVLRVTLEGGAAVFRMCVHNRSAGVVEAAYCPYLGDLRPPQGEHEFKTFLWAYASAQEWQLWPTYQNMRGYYGFDHPVQAAAGALHAGVPMAPYILLRGQREGLYAGVRAPSAELLVWHTELRPGYESSIDHRAPTGTVLAGLDCATRFAAVHLPFIQPGERRELSPVALEAYRGGWQQGTDLYRAWRDTWMRPARAPAWAREPHAWQQLHINSPEDELRLPFTRLPEVAEECARNGVRAIQLVGWNDGGQDQGNPSHDPDPRLGTAEELKAAIARCHELGVRIILFCKFTWSDRATARFREDLVRLAIKDPYGDYYLHPGYQYQTATQLFDVNTKRLVPMCFLSEEYLTVCVDEFRKVLDLEPAGILFDESQHHGPALLCFDPAHGHRAGAPVYANDRLLIARFGEAVHARNPEFLFAGEAVYDWELEAYQLSYHRSESRTHIPLSRYLQPQALFMTAVTGWNDRNLINQCLLYRYIVSYEPYNFKGRLDAYPETVRYGRMMDALRTQLREYFWDGTFRDTVGAGVRRPDGGAHHPYAVFISPDGRTGVAVANYDDTEITLDVRVEGDARLDRWRLVDDPEWRSVDRGVVLPPRSAAVLI